MAVKLEHFTPMHHKKDGIKNTILTVMIYCILVVSQFHSYSLNNLPQIFVNMVHHGFDINTSI